jgi:hypothetical protein
MRPYGENPPAVSTLGLTLETLREAGFERILDVPAVPADGRGRIRYRHQAEVLRTGGGADAEPYGELWSLRSFGTEFDLLLRHWLRSGLTRCYSLGWGLRDGEQVEDLLLIQAVGHQDSMRRMAEVLAPSDASCLHWAWDIGEFHGLPCLRAAAVACGRDTLPKTDDGGHRHA